MTKLLATCWPFSMQEKEKGEILLCQGKNSEILCPRTHFSNRKPLELRGRKRECVAPLKPSTDCSCFPLK